MNAAISQRQYDASGDGKSKDATGTCWVSFRVWREKETGDWYQAHPTDPRGDDVRYEGEVSGAAALA